MSDIQIGLLSIVGILLLIYSGMHVAIALTLLSFLGVGLIKGNWTIASKLLALAASDSSVAEPDSGAAAPDSAAVPFEPFRPDSTRATCGDR